MSQAQPRRKHIRLIGFDYSNAAAYFITICTTNRQNLFWSVQNDGSLSEIGKIAEQEILALPQRFKLIRIDKYVIIPDHVHMIITLGSEREKGNNPPNIANIVGCFKAKVTSRCRGGHDRPKSGKLPSIWQKSFYDHIIRNDEEYSAVYEYIEFNPYKYFEYKKYKNSR